MSHDDVKLWSNKKQTSVICQKQISVEGDGHCCHRPSSNWEPNLTDIGFLSNLASLRALFWALSSTSYSQLIFLVYLPNTLALATSMLTTSRLMSMVLLLNSLILLHLLHLLLQILILGCLLIVCHLILPRPN